ncbi:MAG: hypothetical protein ACR2FN_02940 [Chitinophagaceae bacterium]
MPFQLIIREEAHLDAKQIALKIILTFAYILKKLSAILLLALFIFNLFGYRIVFCYLQQQSDRQFEASIDKEDYNETDLITIKIPLSLPYQTDWKDFERVNGEVNFNGKIYKYVKRKVYNDELILLCLPDESKMRLENAKVEFFRCTNDLQQNSSSKKSDNSSSNNLKNIVSDFEKLNTEKINFLNPQKINYSFAQNISSFLSRANSLPERPPELFYT